jgi:hypothetical protein
MKRSHLSLPLLLCLGFLSGPALAVFDPLDKFYGDADRGELEGYDESQEKPWQESRIGELPMPDEQALLEVAVDRLPPGLRLYIDPASLSVDPEDGVLRFWLVARSGSGAYNATFEGFRCETGEYKVYAYGNPRREHKVRAAPKPAWRDLGKYHQLNYRKELYWTLLCSGKGPRAVADIIATLKGQQDYLHPGEIDNSGF